MTQTLETGNSVQPLTNVARMATLVKELQKRPFGMPGLGVFFGYPGYGKTFGAIFCATTFDVIHVSLQGDWTKKTFLERLLLELGLPPKRVVADMVLQACEGLAKDGRTLIVDEADYAFRRGIIELIRDLHDGSDTPVVMIGMEEFPQKLKRYELIDSRVMSWVAAQPATLKDATLLAGVYAEGIEIHDDLLNEILKRNTGNARRMVVDMAQVKSEAGKLGLNSMSLQDWGDIKFRQQDAPAPRRGLKW
ncbi:ATP-binding protein [Phaeobacter sp. PT47_59]|uniref:AAA family ATPase n=1 Tax=Phaeobacter sp. PT47_59 TaxID=3029979 RepID=UPI002380173C|nr:ATP-binding protein [Phaeobacter sp. PT47_59]MDE4175776.1 ATP-binding protein [Phaeobacter sp. PT47_59]